MRTLFFGGIAGSDDMYYMRFAAEWGRAPVSNWEARLLGNGLTAASMALFGRSEIAAVLPSLAASLAILGSVLYWCRWGARSPCGEKSLAHPSGQSSALRQALWGGLLVAVLPLDVDMGTTISPHTIMAALMVVGTVAFLKAPHSRPAAFIGPIFLSLGVVTHFTGVYYVASLAGAALIVDRRRYLSPVVATIIVGVVVLAADVGVFHLAFDDAFLRLRTCFAETHFIKPIMPHTADGAFNPEYLIWPIRNLLFSKALGVALVVVLIAGLWSYRRLEPTGRILTATMALYWLWISFGSEVPWSYVPFDRISRFLQPLTFAVAVVFASVVATSSRRIANCELRSPKESKQRSQRLLPYFRRSLFMIRYSARRSLSPAVGGVVLAVCVLNLLGSGSWGQNVHISRELLAYAGQHPQRMFVTDYHTLNEMYMVGGLTTLPNVATTDDVRPSKLLDHSARRIPATDLAKCDDILVNPLNLGRTPAFEKHMRGRVGRLRFETPASYRMICDLLPPLRRYPWSVRKPPARVFECLGKDSPRRVIAAAGRPR